MVQAFHDDGKTVNGIAHKLRIPHQTITTQLKRIEERSYELHLPPNHPEVLQDRFRKGRPPWPPLEQQYEIVDILTSTPEWRLMDPRIAIQKLDLKGSEVKDGVRKPLSYGSLMRMMVVHGWRRKKKGWKPLLEPDHESYRYLWALRYRYLNWRNAVSTDEASGRTAEHSQGRAWIEIGHGNPFDTEIVGRKSQKDNKAKGQITGSLSYYEKGPIGFLFPETEDQKEQAKVTLVEENKERDPLSVLAFCADDLRDKDNYLNKHGRIKPGKQRDVKVYLRQAKVSRGDRSRGGMDWFRYREEVLIPLLIPFIQRLQQEHGIKVFVCEDNAGIHKALYCQEEYHKAGIYIIPWPANSPDLNVIEKAWGWCRQYLRDRNMYAEDNDDLVRHWHEAWEQLPMELVRKWFDELPSLCEKVIKCKGGNEFNS